MITTPGARSTNPRLQIALAFSAFILLGASAAATGVLLPSIIAHYAVDKSTIGLLFLGGTTGYMLAAFTSGLLLQKLGRRAFMLVGGACYLAGMVGYTLMPPFVVLIAVMLCLGFGEGIIDSGLNGFIAGLPRNTLGLNHLHAIYGVGALLGPIIASIILTLQWGWNTTYIIWMVIAVPILVGFGTLFPKRDYTPVEPKAMSQSNVLRASLAIPVVWIAAFFLFFDSGAESSTSTWSYSLLTEDRHGGTLLSGWLVSGYWLGLTIGRVVMGHLAERLGNRRLIHICIAGTIAGVLLIWASPVIEVAGLGLVLTGFSIGPIFPTTIAIINEIVPARVQQSAIGFASSVGGLGSTFFPWAAGGLAQYFGMWTLLPYIIGISIIMIVFWAILQAGSRHSVVAGP